MLRHAISISPSLRLPQPAPPTAPRSLRARAFSATPSRLADPKPTPGKEKPLYDEQKQSDSWQYSADRDPMLKLSKEELDKIKKEIDSGSRRAFSIGIRYGVIGFGMIVALFVVYMNRSSKPSGRVGPS
ncbi:hypothetical protein DFJ74DRAFT_710444 [Hyaloraphidium curvatum]|nr:hypothetical protein DFJ74DRAFT_710444 [Hyaloraphidium curvatum]